MKRTVHAMLAAAVVAVTFAATAHAGTSVDFRISVGDRYRGATIEYRSEPEVVLVPRTKVYYVRDQDYDVYRYGRYWYFVEEGRWYRARSWRGPFLYVKTATVPRSVRGVPVKYRRNWTGPPSHAVARGHHKDGRHDARVERAHERHDERHAERAHDRRVEKRVEKAHERAHEREREKGPKKHKH